MTTEENGRNQGKIYTGEVLVLQDFVGFGMKRDA